MAKVLGIDLGSAAVKVAIYEGTFGRLQFKEYWSRAVPQSVEEAPDIGRRLATLRALMDEVGEDTQIVTTTAFPSDHASFRLITLPFGDRNQVERTIPFEVEGQVPFDLEDMLLVYRVLKVAPGESRVLAAVVDREQLQALLGGLASADVDPKHLPLDADMLGVFARRGVQAVVDLGHSRTLVALAQDGAVVGARALNGGGRDLTLAVAAAGGLGWEDAEALRRAMSLAPEGAPPAPAVVGWEPEDEEDTNPVVSPNADTAVRDLQANRTSRALEAAWSALLADLRATLIAFEDSHGLEVDELVLTGGLSAQPGLVARLSTELGVPVRLALVSPAAEAMGDPGTLGLAHALGLKAAGLARGQEMELRTGEFAYRGDLSAYAAYVGYAAVGLLAFMVAGLMLFTWQSVRNARDRAAIEAEITVAVETAFPGEVDPAQARDPAMALAIMQEKTLAATTQLETLQAIVSDTPPQIALLRDLSDAMPAASDARVDVSELTGTDTTVTAKLETDGFEAATRIENALQSRPAFQAATKSDSKKVGDAVRFTVTIPLGGAQPGEEG